MILDLVLLENSQREDYNENVMNGQIVTKIETIEKELEELKALVKYEDKNPSKKLTTMKGIWRKLKISDKDIDDAKKSLFDYDIERHVGKGK